MGDLRPFYKVDVGYFDNPKIADFLEDHPRVLILHQRAIAYCRQHLTDGAFPHARVARLACASFCGSECDSHSDSLCDLCRATHAGLFDRLDARESLVHDYLEHQQSAEQAGKRKIAGQKAAEARWKREGGNRNGAQRNANRIANRNADRNAEKRREEKNSLSEIRPDTKHLCDLLADLIEANGSKRPTTGKTWHDAARLLLDRDKRDPAEAERLIRWCQTDDFWRANILSMTKFREKYDQLRMRAGGGKPEQKVPAYWAEVGT